jgi:hypothetical protein
MIDYLFYFFGPFETTKNHLKKKKKKKKKRKKEEKKKVLNGMSTDCFVFALASSLACIVCR